jgi:RNA polymerase sigma factor (sigma-70 family)
MSEILKEAAMWSRPESDEAIMKRLLPSTNPDRVDRSAAWNEWQVNAGQASVLKFIRCYNNTRELDEDILQEALLTAYLEVECERYERRTGVPFTAYVKGIARNKIREARRRERGLTSLEEAASLPENGPARQLESAVEHREQRYALANGLAALPHSRRAVLERYIHGESTAEIASSLAISEELVRQHKSRGLRSLQQKAIFA